MARFTSWANNSHTVEIDYFTELETAMLRRRTTVWKIQHDLATLAAGLGQTETQIETKIDALFSTFAAEWAIFALTGSPAISIAIQNDVTLPWLDTDVAGTTIRQRLINRLS